MTQSLLNVKTDETLILICEEKPIFKLGYLSSTIFFLFQKYSLIFLYNAVCVCVITEHLFQGTGKVHSAKKIHQCILCLGLEAVNNEQHLSSKID
jgi:hypothetical protein